MWGCRFDDPRTKRIAFGEGATIEHILPRTLGGDNDLRNLGVAHRRCNGEKGRRWDAPVMSPLRRHLPLRYSAHRFVIAVLFPSPLVG